MCSPILPFGLRSRDRLQFSKTNLKRFLKDCIDRDPSAYSPWLVKAIFAEKYGIPTEMSESVRARIEENKEEKMEKRRKPKTKREDEDELEEPAPAPKKQKKGEWERTGIRRDCILTSAAGPSTVTLSKEEKARIAEEERIKKEEEERVNEEEERKKRRKPTKFPAEGECHWA